MPLTIAHPALAVPFKKAGLMLSPLIVGSVMPDFEFFLSLSTSKLIGHSLLGLFLFCIPLGLITLFIFHKLIKYPLISLLPHSHQEKLLPVASQFSFSGAGRFLNIILSLLVGAASHVVLDSFCHPGGLTVQIIPFLSAPVLTLSQGTIRVYFVLQYLFSASGVVLLFRWYRSWYKGTPNLLARIPQHPLLFCSRGRAKIGIFIGSFSLGGGLVFGFLTAPGLGSIDTLNVFLTNSVIATGTSFLLALVTYGILWHHLLPRHRKEHFRAGMRAEQI